MNRLNKLRTEKRITLRELAEKVNIDYTALSRVENGKRNLTDNDIAILCSFFNVSSDYLLGFSDIRQSTPQTPTVPNLQFALHGYEDSLSDDDKEMILSLAKKLANKNDTE